MRIESHDRYDDVAEFDPATGRLQEFSRTTGRAATPVPARGHYARLSGTLAVLYRLDTSLWIRIGDQARNLDQAGIEVRWGTAEGQSELELIDNGALVCRVQYRPEPGGGPEDPTPFAEPEHFDFGLFVTNVLRNDGRRVHIYRGADES